MAVAMASTQRHSRRLGPVFTCVCCALFIVNRGVLWRAVSRMLTGSTTRMLLMMTWTRGRVMRRGWLTIRGTGNSWVSVCEQGAGFKGEVRVQGAA